MSSFGRGRAAVRTRECVLLFQQYNHERAKLRPSVIKSSRA